METRFSRAARARPITRAQLELIVGSLLGDGTLLRTTRGYCFRAHHGFAQRALVDWKYSLLREFVRTPPRLSGRGYYFRTVSHDQLSNLHETFYTSGHKSVPFELLEQYLSPFALAVWIMDDGARDGSQLRLNTQCFAMHEVEGLATLLDRKFGTPSRINIDKGKPRLRFLAKGMQRIHSIVSPHIVPEMRYKLPHPESSVEAYATQERTGGAARPLP